MIPFRARMKSFQWSRSQLVSESGTITKLMLEVWELTIGRLRVDPRCSRSDRRQNERLRRIRVKSFSRLHHDDHNHSRH